MKFPTKTKRRSRQIDKPKPFIYDSLDIIPYKTFMRVFVTRDLSLLSNEENDVEVLTSIWEEMEKQHFDYRPSSEDKKVLRLNKAIDVLISKHNQILLYVEALEWEVVDWVIEKIREYGFQMRDDNNENYHNDLDRIRREVNSLIMQANQLKKQLPKPKENADGQQEYKIDDLMASYMVITGVGFNFNKITYTAFRGIELQVDAKIKSLEAQNNAAKANARK